jgi:hypothetical protein
MQTVEPIKRDFNLIRKIMLHISKGFQVGQHFQLPPYPVNDLMVNLQVYFLADAGMIKAYCDKNQFTGQVPVTWIVDILPAGYDFLALIQDNKNWDTVMESFTAAHIEPNFKDLIYRLEHIEDTLYLKERRDMVRKQSRYATVTMVATCVMTAAIIVQAIFMWLTFSHSANTGTAASPRAPQEQVLPKP